MCEQHIWTSDFRSKSFGHTMAASQAASGARICIPFWSQCLPTLLRRSFVNLRKAAQTTEWTVIYAHCTFLLLKQNSLVFSPLDKLTCNAWTHKVCPLNPRLLIKYKQIARKISLIMLRNWLHGESYGTREKHLLKDFESNTQPGIFPLVYD